MHLRDCLLEDRLGGFDKIPTVRHVASGLVVDDGAAKSYTAAIITVNVIEVEIAAAACVSYLGALIWRSLVSATL